jgi:hypothetical protein
MMTTNTNSNGTVLYAEDDDSIEAVMSRVGAIEAPLSRTDSNAMAAINRSEIECQLDAAHRYPRSIASFIREAMSLATLSVEVAQSCIFALPRGGKIIPGPSIRLAEIVASAYSNVQIGKRVLGAEAREVVAQGACWDMERNNRITVEVRRRITDKEGQRYNDDMITMTGNAAASIAMRNAIFTVVPGAYIQQIYRKVQEVAVGTQATLTDRRAKGIAALAKMGVPLDRVLSRVKKPSVEDIGLVELEQLIALWTAIKHDAIRIDDAFPAVGATAAGERPDTKDLEATLRAQSKATPKPPIAEAKPVDTAPAAPTPAATAKATPRAREEPAPTPKPAQPAGKRDPKEPPFGAQSAAPPTAANVRAIACAVCGNPTGAGAVATMLPDGTRGVRHAGCLPFESAARSYQSDADEDGVIP